MGTAEKKTCELLWEVMASITCSEDLLMNSHSELAGVGTAVTQRKTHFTK